MRHDEPVAMSLEHRIHITSWDDPNSELVGDVRLTAAGVSPTKPVKKKVRFAEGII